MATFGLAGDSHLRFGGPSRFQFESQRCLPLCRAAQRYPGFSLAALEEELSGEWHHGDPELIELAGLDQYCIGKGAPTLSAAQMRIVEQLQQGPRRLKTLREAAGERHFTEEVADLIRKRAIVRIALTPTDLFCAAGRAPVFNQADARHALRLYARMLDIDADVLHQVLAQALRRQATAILAAYLCGFDPPLEPGGSVMERLVDLLVAPQDGNEPALALDPHHPIVLVGAGAPVLYGDLPEAMAKRIVVPPGGDVANALGAITSSFLLRESVSIEPLRYGGVELYDHHGKETFPNLETALVEGRRRIETVLMERAKSLRLTGIELTWHENRIEDYVEFSKRTQKEVVVARLEGVLTGMPE
jgi:hypothetical protein